MKPGKVELTNFQSYAHLEFDYSNLGLALVSGVTGSGKSSLLDALPWILFGTTSKEGAADDVRSWFAEEPTVGTAQVELPAGEVMFVTRKRSKNSKDNDLYFYIEKNAEHGSADPTRGKDVYETQRIIEAKLGTTPELFDLGSYLSQFSRADSFFVAKAKDRRETMEKVADLTLAVKLSTRTSEARKGAKKLLETKELFFAREEGKASEAEQNLEAMSGMRAKWEVTQVEKISDLSRKYDGFDAIRDEKITKIVRQLEELDVITVSPAAFDEREAQTKQQLAALGQVRKDHDTQSSKMHSIRAEHSVRVSERDKIMSVTESTCPRCMGPVNNPNRKGHLKELDAIIFGLTRDLELQRNKVIELAELLKMEDKHRKAYDQIRTERANNDRLLDKFEALQKEALTLRNSVNAYADQLESAKNEVNPFDAKIEEVGDKVTKAKAAAERTRLEVVELKQKVVGLNWLYDKSFELRGALMQKAVRQINDHTNAYLEKYFDASLRVTFDLADSDKLDVEINNGGYSCPFKQLSGGERRMLTLSFSVALMRAAQNRAGIKFNLIMLDEALNGLDDGLKVKAFGLLQELETEYETVLLIDHCEEFKTLFSNRFVVTNAGHSEVTVASE